MDIRLYQRNYRDDLKQAIQQEQSASYIDAALSYKKAQHHAASANMLSKAKFAMARRIRCLRQRTGQKQHPPSPTRRIFCPHGQKTGTSVADFRVRRRETNPNRFF